MNIPEKVQNVDGFDRLFSRFLELQKSCGRALKPIRSTISNTAVDIELKMMRIEGNFNLQVMKIKYVVSYNTRYSQLLFSFLIIIRMLCKHNILRIILLTFFCASHMLTSQ